MLMAVNEPYALMVQPDDILISPREVDEHFGTMVCFHPRYALGDHHNYMDKDDFLREMYLDTVGHDEAGMKRYERMVNIVSSRFRHGPKTEERAIDEAMQKVISEKYLMLPLYLYDHSGLAMSTESFSGRAPHAEWDSGQVGWIYVSKEDALKEFDADKMTGAIRQKADALMRSEVAAYDSYLRGECYGFELYCAAGDLHRFRNFNVGHVEKVVQQYGLSFFVRQGVQSFGKQFCSNLQASCAKGFFVAVLKILVNGVKLPFFLRGQV